MEINKTVYEAYGNDLKNKLFGLLCEFEKKREWEKFLDNILIELEGVPIEEQTINYLKLYRKVSSLRYLRYEYFRTTVFDCMNIISRMW